ncbi:hypothetical protein JHK86_010287 [Glycine max]|nr:hypothetical protein JHK86_010287 [Glycine max]
MLLLALNDPHKKICTTIGMVVASIAMHDWLELWPDLLPFLLNLINNQTNMNGEFIQNFSSLFTSEFEVYEKVSIEGTEDSHEGRYDFDGSEKSLDSFVIQFMAMPAFANICQLGDILQNMIPPPGRSFAPKQTDAPMSVARSLQNVMAGVRGSLDATTLRLESYKTNGSEF